MTDAYAEKILVDWFKNMEGLEITEDGQFPEVCFPNHNFERPEDGYWYELFFIPGGSQQIELGSEARSRWVGLLRINVCVPKDTGVTAANDRYENIARHFRSGAIIEGVRIARTSRSSAIEDGDDYIQPVTVEFWADLDR